MTDFEEGEYEGSIFIKMTYSKIDDYEGSTGTSNEEKSDYLPTIPLPKNYSDMTWQDVLNDKVILRNEGFKLKIFSLLAYREFISNYNFETFLELTELFENLYEFNKDLAEKGQGSITDE